ncbi:hypothetical protein [uncultured Tenacibaculum sp.]|uniref:hypothetical protein n=1 Tax=uncultured Tenacibaculum sp. TaxID=174713 RepID=UPI002602CBFF|nr:hypothetical protein [uncultured Tenacibaculum sp.]
MACKIEIPQGIQIPLNQNSPEKLADNINFSYLRSTRPLQPLVSVNTSDEGILQSASAVVLIDASIPISEVNPRIIQQFSYTNEGVPFLNFYICYDFKPVGSKTFNAYRFDFSVNWNDFSPNPVFDPKAPIPAPSSIKFITSFLWDEDPETSRGTVTTVKKGL